MRMQDGCLFLMALVCAACRDDPTRTSPVDINDAGPSHSNDDDESIGDGDGDDGEVCETGEKLSCTCAEGGAGHQLCSDGVYGTCTGCVESEPSLCIPGHYEGKFAITYWSGADDVWPGVIGPLESNHEETITDFDLTKNGGDEFYTLGNGCIRAQMSSLPDVKPALSELSGQLDCTTGKLIGTVRGYYAVRNTTTGMWTNYFFRGPLIATYDPKQRAFTGTYDIKEPPRLFGEPPGGKGEFSAKYQADVAAEQTPTSGGCLDVKFPDDMFK